MEHKELRQLLDAMIRTARLSFERTGDLQPFAMSVNEQGKVAQLAFPQRPDRSAEETTKAIAERSEDGRAAIDLQGGGVLFRGSPG